MNNEQNKAADESYDNMSTLSGCMTSLMKKGYKENLQVKKAGLVVAGEDKTYKPTDVRIDNFYRFEGSSNPSDNAVLYAVSMQDGKKGTLVDAYGSDADELIGEFVQSVQDIHKKEANG